MIVINCFQCLYIFLVLWIIPCYPRYRKCFRISLTHFLNAMLFTLIIHTVVILFFYERQKELILSLPLMAAVSYVDQRDGEIPDLPIFMMVFFAYINPSSPEYYTTFAVVAVLSVMAEIGKIGWGDVKLIGVWMYYLGFRGLYGLCIACVLCYIVCMVKKEPPAKKIPFGPYICTGMTVMLCLPV